ncbi:MAG TPA: sucrose-phosphate phosphatase, partial [Ignavibacteriaceae bacterium]
AMNKIIDNKNLWNDFSVNGIKNVRKYYTWKAHVEAYLEEAEKLIKQTQDNTEAFAPVGRKLLVAEKLIVTDIDNTLVGEEDALKEFIELLNSTDSKVGFAVATGRNIDSAVEILKEYNIPFPDIFISSVGSEIYYNYRNELIPSTGWKAHIRYQWNRDKVKKILSKLDFLKYQDEENQREFKLSYFMDDDENLLEEVKNTLIKNKIKANVIFSNGEFLDILPYRASKGKAIRYLAYRWNLPYENILVAGDSGNDSEMLKGDLLGVVVANYSPELEELKGQSRVYFAKRKFAGGIIEGINHYDFLKKKSEVEVEQED